MRDDFFDPPAVAMSDAAFQRRGEHLLAEMGREASALRRPLVVALVTVALVVFVLAPIGGASLAARGADTISSLWSEPAAPPNDPASAANLAEAASRWTAESSEPSLAPGKPLLGKARDLLQGVGSASDAVTAFPTANGAVCYEVRGAGSCARLDRWPWSVVGFTFGVLWTRTAGTTRIYGVASDSVQKIDVVIGGVNHTATLENNAFYYELPNGAASGDVQRVVATWTDGSVHTFHWKDGLRGVSVRR